MEFGMYRVNTTGRSIAPISSRLCGFFVTAAVASIAGPTQDARAQDASAALLPAEATAAAAEVGWETPRFSWGDPNLEGTFTSRDMSGIPMQRPAQFGERASLTPEEFEARATGGPSGLSALAGQQSNDDRLQLSALDSTELGSRTFGYSSYVIDPPNGRIPALTEEGEARRAARSAGQANGPFFTPADFSYYDRCISRGVTGSILPSLYGDAMRIVQSPTEVAITYEMLHDTRVIPLDGKAQADDGVRQYMGSSVGYWDGDTLVVETANLTDELAVGRMPHSEDLKLTERFTRIDPDMIDYVVTVDDPRTFQAPWTFRLTLTTQPDYEVLEYSCHEGNFFVASALRAEQNYQRSVQEAIDNGEPIPPRETPGGGGIEIYAPPSAADAIDMNAAQ